MSIIKTATLYLLCIVASHPSFGQVRNIVIDSANGPNEPSITIDPRNPSHMVAGSNTDNVYSSTDGGLTWRLETLTSSLGVFGDPVIIADTTGAFYYFHLAQNRNIFTWPRWADRIVCQRMDHIATGTWTNGGYTKPTDTPAISDKPGIAIDRKTNTLYACWTNFDNYGSTVPADSSNIYFSRSADRGNTWSTPMRINKDAGDCTDDDPTVEGAVPCVGPNGEVYVAWASYNRLMFDRSYDGGHTWLDEDIYVASIPGGWNYMVPGLNRCNGLPYTACDLSNGPDRGAIYINWTDQRYGTGNTDVWICKSTDKGETWNTAKRVNDDTGATQQFMSSMTVDPATGYIYILFYDRRNYSDSTTATDVYLAVSKDGAVSFQNFRISRKPFYPDLTGFFGDYTFIAAFNNVVRPVWGSFDANAPRPYRQKIITAIIDSTITGSAAVADIHALDLDLQLYPNPVPQQATLAYELGAPETVTITITDISGRIVATLRDNQLLMPGRHTERINAKSYGLLPGLYFLCFRTAQYTQTIKMVTR